MDIYIFEWIDKLTSNYHSEGGLCVVAKDRDAAVKLIEEASGCDDTDITEEEWAKVFVYPLECKHDERVFVFPDAGCC